MLVPGMRKITQKGDGRRTKAKTEPSTYRILCERRGLLLVQGRARYRAEVGLARHDVVLAVLTPATIGDGPNGDDVHVDDDDARRREPPGSGEDNDDEGEH